MSSKEGSPGYGVRLDDLYRDVIMEHYRHPSYKGEPQSSDVQAEGFNPLCGDHVKIFLKTQLCEGCPKIQECFFDGEGCSICMASADIMSEKLEGLSPEEAMEAIKEFRAMMQGESGCQHEHDDVKALEGVKDFPVRIKCAVLPWTTATEAIEKIDDKK